MVAYSDERSRTVIVSWQSACTVCTVGTVAVVVAVAVAVVATVAVAVAVAAAAAGGQSLPAAAPASVPAPGPAPLLQLLRHPIPRCPETRPRPRTFGRARSSTLTGGRVPRPSDSRGRRQDPDAQPAWRCRNRHKCNTVARLQPVTRAATCRVCVCAPFQSPRPKRKGKEVKSSQRQRQVKPICSSQHIEQSRDKVGSETQSASACAIWFASAA